MKKTFLKALSIILCLAITFTLLAACGGNDGGGGGGGITAPQTASDGVLVYSLMPDKSGYAVTRLVDKAYTDTINVPGTIEGLPVKEVAAQAFSQTGITQISFSENLKKVGARAFYSCFDLESVSFPASLEEFAGDSKGNIDDFRTFFACRSLTSVTFANGCKLREIPSRAFDCSWLSSIRIPAAVEKIGDNAFTCVRKYPKPHYDWEDSSITDGCDGTFTVTFESGSKLKTVEDYAFHASAVVTFDLPLSATDLGISIFDECPNYKK